MLQRKREAIRREEVRFNRDLHFEFSRMRDLQEKERTLINNLKSKETPVS